MLTNGNINVAESDQPIQEQVALDCQNVIEQSHADCVIYDDDNVVLLTDDHCCEIIVSAHGVHTDHEMERSYLMGLQPANEQERLNNGVNYCNDMCAAEEFEEHNAESHVYLSDAALDQQHQHQQHAQHHQQEQQQLLLDGVEEDPNQASDSYGDDRPDICEVYDHELEDQDDDCIVNEQENNLQLQLQHAALGHHHQQEHQQQQLHHQQQQLHYQQQQLHHQQQQQQQLNIFSSIEETHAIDDRDQQATAATVTASDDIPHSSTTEFPVSSTSMPNASDYDDYDDDGTAEEPSPPRQRKYMPLLKNTLSAEAMDRRLANICQSQPQLSLEEKVTSWNCSQNCEAVEDVENFEAVFQQHEAEPAKQQTFGEFCEYLRQNFLKMTQAMQEQPVEDAVDATVAPDTPYSSDDAVRQKRPCYRRLLHTVPVQQTELIILDDDDDDDCYEVMVNPSSTTLVPQLRRKSDQADTLMKAARTQNFLSLRVDTKETSTTDLGNCEPNTAQQEYNECHEYASMANQNRQGETRQHQLDGALSGARERDQNHIMMQQQQQQELQRLSSGKFSDVNIYRAMTLCLTLLLFVFLSFSNL